MSLCFCIYCVCVYFFPGVAYELNRHYFVGRVFSFFIQNFLFSQVVYHSGRKEARTIIVKLGKYLVLLEATDSSNLRRKNKRPKVDDSRMFLSVLGG